MNPVLPEKLELYEADLESLRRRFSLPGSQFAIDRFRAFYQDWQSWAAALAARKLLRSDRIDLSLFQNLLQYQLAKLDEQERTAREQISMLPFLGGVQSLLESWQLMQRPDGACAASALQAFTDGATTLAEAPLASTPDGAATPERTLRLRCARLLDSLRPHLTAWFDFYNGYDPVFTWWVAQPYAAAMQALDALASALAHRPPGVSAADAPVAGHPIGRSAIERDLLHEQIAYSPEELMAIAGREMEWCQAEMKRASRDLGFGSDWRKALEHVKNAHVAPGEQPQLVRQLADEAIAYVQQHNLVTAPPLAIETWQMAMMSPERQQVNPYFLGGETITVSFPTGTMAHEQKLMSLRANNRHFARATVFHELIPGHHLQMFQLERCRRYRRVFATPFWLEGWTVYWEMLLWDRGFTSEPADRVGALFWRMHRCARVLFSLGFHLGDWPAQQCVDYLVDAVGHERSSAEAEVRRSFEGSYPPLYQAAYLIGALQVRALRQEVVEGGRMTEREFHDRMLEENQMPITVLRALMLNLPLPPEPWRFYPL